YLPRLAPGLPQSGEEDARVGRVEADIRSARVAVLAQYLLPGLAAVGGAIDPALAVGTEGVAEDRREGDVRVGRVDGHGADLALLLPDVLPGLTGIGGFVDAVARRHVAADVGLATADVDHVRVGRGDGDGADGGDRLVVEDRLPGDTAVR